MENLDDRMIRVFARKTNWTPRRGLVFFGPPPSPLFRERIPVRVSVTFTWDRARGRELFNLWSECSDDIRIGGPAFDDPGNEFVPGRFIKEGVTFTSRGCPKTCPWCLVPKREGQLWELPVIHPGNIVQDNNLLACSRPHIERVFDMLKTQKAVQFKGGMDIDYLRSWHVDLLKQISLKEIWVACDRDEDLVRLDKAVDLLADISIEKKRCYVMVGRDGETKDHAQRRCESVLAKGFLPYAQLYRGPASLETRGEWRNFCYYWSQPKLYRKTATAPTEQTIINSQ